MGDSIKNMVVVDRVEFKMWSQGVILDFSHGLGIAVNEVACSEAQKVLNDGGEVLLSENGKIVSKMKLIGDCYTEFEL